MDLTILSEIELKALAYDQLVLRDNITRNIQAVNQELANRFNPEVVEPKQETPND